MWSSTSHTSFSYYDISIMLCYFVLIILIGISNPIYQFLKRKFSSASSTSTPETEAYFLAGRSVTWFAVGASLFCSNVGAENFIGMAGSAASINAGLSVAFYEISGSIAMPFLAYVYAPIYLHCNIFTTPEYIEKRFDSRALRTYLVLLSLLIYVFTKISVTIYATCIILNALLGWNMWISSLFVVIATGFYTIVGGFRAVIYTELLQTIILLIGATILMILSLLQVGGLETLMQAKPEQFHIIKSPLDPYFPWPGLLMQGIYNSVWYWCTDQLLVQRILCAKSVAHAQGGCVLAGYFKCSTIFLLAIPGIVSSVLYPTEVQEDSNRAFLLLVTRLMPIGVKGLLGSAMLSASMSSLSSLFNSSSTLITMDLYQQWKPKSSEKELLVVGKVSSALLMLVSILWIPVMTTMSEQLYVYIHSIVAYFTPPIAALFLAAIFWKRTTTTAAYVSMGFSFLFGAIRLCCEIIYKNRVLEPYNVIIWIFSKLNFLYFGSLLFLFAITSLIIVSLMTKKLEKNVEQYCINWQQIWNDWKSKFTKNQVEIISSELEEGGIASSEEQTVAISNKPSRKQWIKEVVKKWTPPLLIGSFSVLLLCVNVGVTVYFR